MRKLNELSQSKHQVLIIVLALVLSISAFILLESFRDSIQNSVSSDSKTLAGGDIIISAHQKFSNNLSLALEELGKKTDVTIVDSYEFSTIIYSKDENTSLLSELKLVKKGYPLYGSLQLEKKNGNSDSIGAGEIVVEKNLLERLNVQIGDKIKIGKKSFIIKDIIIKEPDRPLSFFSIGPRIIANFNDFRDSSLIGDKSRVEYKTYLKLEDETKLETYLSFLKANSGPRENIKPYTEEQNSIQWFVDSFLLFLQIIVFFSIILGGIGMSSALTSFFDEKRNSIAIRKTLGETNKSILKYYSLIVFLFVCTSFLIIFLLSFGVIQIVPFLLGSLIPKELVISLSVVGILKGFLLLLAISFIFALIPLKSLRFITPLEILRGEDIKQNKINFKDKILIVFLIIVVAVLMLIEFKKIVVGIKFLGGFFVLSLIVYFLVSITLIILKKINFKSYLIKLGIKSILRKGNKNKIILTTLTCALTLIFTIFFLQFTLQEQFSKSFPSNAPNVFFIDIQPNQIKNFTQEFKNPIDIFPIVRGRILQARGLNIEQLKKESGPGDSLTREFSLTYSNYLIGKEKLTQTNYLFLNNSNKTITQVSVMDEIANRLGVKIGDEIKFNIQGVDLSAQVVSIRTRTTQTLSPFFYFIFEPKILKDAPQTIFSSMKLLESDIPKKQLEIAKKYPNITTIDLTQILKIIRNLVSKFSSIITFFALISITSGILIFIGSLYSTAQTRTKESVYYKLVGMKGKDVQKIFLFEYALLGIISSLLSVLLAHVTSAVIVKYFFEFDYSYSILSSLFLVFISTFLIVFIGVISSYKIINKKPIDFLRNNNRE